MNRITIGMCGDVMIGRLFNSIFKNEPSYNVWGNTLGKLKGVDMVIMNLETTITEETDKYPGKVFNYKANPSYSRVLKVNAKTYCNLANNHILDFKLKGLTDTIYYLKNRKISFGGAGETLKEAKELKTINVKGLRVGVLGCANHYPYWTATEDGAGIWYVDPTNPKQLKEVFGYVKRCKKRCDVLVVSCHMQPNYVDKIDASIISFYRELVDCGVSVVHGHSPHHVLPMERHGKGLICYSLGDFVDDYAISYRYRNDLGVLVNVSLAGDRVVKVDALPTKNFHTISPLAGEYRFQVNLLKEGSEEHNFVTGVLNKDL